jgi:hypothetical protein
MPVEIPAETPVTVEIPVEVPAEVPWRFLKSYLFPKLRHQLKVAEEIVVEEAVVEEESVPSVLFQLKKKHLKHPSKLLLKKLWKHLKLRFHLLKK